ncbi:MAG TPA: insulinase family protein, partial [Ruminococcaceae bacterium]|nr:insulinase family protein [Oscillospiraceae bacterium]
MTCYLFSCSGRFADSFEILLDFVSSPYFTEQTVQKEQGIIGQEISMNDDNAPWKVFFNLLGVLYKEHPVRIDIAGTADSIAKITPELLYGCYNTFYNPGNMFICVAGNFSADEVLAAIDAGIKKVEPVEIERGRFDEPPEVVRDYIEQKMEVSLPLFALGFKEVCDKPQKSTEEKILTELLLEILAGNASPLYYELFSSGLINEEFAAEYFTGEGHAAVIFQGESERPEEVRDKVLDALKSLRENGVSKEEFERARKKLYGRYIMRYNAVENIAHMLTQCAQTGSGLFDDIAVLENAAPEKL